MLQEEDVFGKLMNRVEGALRKATKRLHSKQQALQQQLNQVSQADKHQKQADLIVANLYRYAVSRPADMVLQQHFLRIEILIVQM